MLVGLTLVLFLYPVSTKADGLIPIIDLELGIMGAYLDDDASKISIGDSTLTIQNPIMGLGYAFIGYKFISMPLIGLHVEALGVQSLVGHETNENIGNIRLDIDLNLQTSYGLGLKGTFGLWGLKIYARAGYAKYELEFDGQAHIESSSSSLTDSNTKNDVYVGVGVRSGLLTFGYYFMPGLGNAHVASLGVAF